MTSNPPTHPIKALLSKEYIIAVSGVTSAICAHFFRIGYFEYFGLDFFEIPFAFEYSMPVMICVLFPTWFVISLMYEVTGRLLLGSENARESIISIAATACLIGCFSLLSLGFYDVRYCLSVSILIVCFVWLTWLLRHCFVNINNHILHLKCFWQSLALLFGMMLIGSNLFGHVMASLQFEHLVVTYKSKSHLVLSPDPDLWFLVPLDKTQLTFSRSHIPVDKTDFRYTISRKSLGRLTPSPEPLAVISTKGNSLFEVNNSE